MGIYEHSSSVGSWVCLRELVTGNEFECCVPAGYRGKQGELWYVRCCPPLGDLFDYHLALLPMSQNQGPGGRPDRPT